MRSVRSTYNYFRARHLPDKKVGATPLRPSSKTSSA